MKKLFEDGLVERNTTTKPFSYSITEKGRQRIGIGGSGTVQMAPEVV
jgi:predicted transcriptional regulator